MYFLNMLESVIETDCIMKYRADVRGLCKVTDLVCHRTKVLSPLLQVHEGLMQAY